MTRTLQIDKYQFQEAMDNFTTAVKNKNFKKIPYSSWTLLKKVSNWEGLISIEYTDKELDISIQLLRELCK